MPSRANARIINVRLEAHPDVLRAGRKLVAAAAEAMGASPTAVFELEIAIGEALANAYDHAYRGGRRSGPVSIRLIFERDSLVAIVSDVGERRRARPPRVPQDVPLTARRGRGLFLMSRLMDDIEVNHPVRAGKGTAVRMTKRLRPEWPAAGRSQPNGRGEQAEA